MSKTVLLGDIINLKRGFDLPASRREKGRYAIVSSSGITDFHNEAKVKGPGVITGRYGTLGKAYYIQDDYWPLNTTLYVEDFKGNNPKYVAYLLSSLKLGEENIAGAVPGVNRNFLHKIKVPYIAKGEQDKAVKLIDSIDEKIELNRRMNETLEQMGQALFKQYFITSPEAETWPIRKVGDILSALESGSRPKGGAIDNGVPSVGAENIIGLGKYDFSKEKFVSEEFYNKLSRGKVKSEDVLLYKDGAYVGKKSLFMDDFPHVKCIVNEHVFILRANSSLKSQFYLYFWLDQPEITKQIIDGGVKAAQPGINQSNVNGLPILLPPENMVKDFDASIRPFMERLFLNANERKTLTALRDTLLPRLISGKIKL